MPEPRVPGCPSNECDIRNTCTGHLACPRRQPPKAGYHTTEIPRGIYGDVSKILEEALELVDSDAQSARIMSLCEVSDLVGAILGYLAKYHPGIKMDDILKMVEITRRAFESGHRKPSPQAHVAEAVFEVKLPAKYEIKTRTLEECHRCGDFHLHPDDCPRDPGPAHP